MGGFSVILLNMGQWIHRLTHVDRDNKQAVCSNCGPVRIKVNNISGKIRCRKAFNKEKNTSAKKNYQLLKGLVCNKCGFIAEHPCQIDLDHIDGDPQNNESSNLESLCANCHRLKTFLNRDWESRGRK